MAKCLLTDGVGWRRHSGRIPVRGRRLRPPRCEKGSRVRWRPLHELLAREQSPGKKFGRWRCPTTFIAVRRKNEGGGLVWHAERQGGGGSGLGWLPTVWSRGREGELTCGLVQGGTRLAVEGGDACGPSWNEVGR
jgi:hypothetical protein